MNQPDYYRGPCIFGTVTTGYSRNIYETFQYLYKYTFCNTYSNFYEFTSWIKYILNEISVVYLSNLIRLEYKYVWKFFNNNLLQTILK